MHLLKVISDPENEEYKEMKLWIGEDFDSEYFDKEVINIILAEKNYGFFSI